MLFSKFPLAVLAIVIGMAVAAPLSNAPVGGEFRNFIEASYGLRKRLINPDIERRGCNGGEEDPNEPGIVARGDCI